MLSVFQLNRNIRSLRRYRQIVRVLVKYGFEHALSLMGLSRFVARGRRLFRKPEPELARLSPAERMRLALEELGPTFVKLGQILSTRPDVIPRSFVLEFARLQDQVPSFPFEDALDQIRRELGRDPEERFSFIDPEPLAAASIAQVHRARLVSGEEVVVKVRRPGVVEAVETDIDAMMGLAVLAERHLPRSDIYDPVGLVKEFARTIRREMDFAREGHTIERFAENFAGDPTLYFPTVHWDCTARGLLTMEFINGIKVSDTAALERAGMDRRLIARRGADAFLKMVLTHGFFHGDPHPGNVLILPDNVICLLDYGMVGRLDAQLKGYLTDILLAIVQRDVDEVISLLLYSGEIADTLDTRALKRDLTGLIDNYYETPLQEIEVGRVLLEFLEVITTYHIKFQPDLMLLAKALVAIEGMGRELDPAFDMVEHLRPFMKQAVRDRFSPRQLIREMNSNLLSYFTLARNLPRDLKELLNRINRNKFKIDLEHRGLDRAMREFDKSVNRLSSSLIIAALIVGSSIVMQTDKGPKFLDFPVFAFMGYTIAGFIGLWWVVAIIRSGRL
ncbi:ABC1 kinase family protein [Geobacter sulfurreducens]|uniref:ABC1 kinase family protein n=1 Tax=Geobacter sulfurreducens TaxID=35554 RepID=UPI0001D8F591|nr:AarF/UbiB family protein [Geobacter sulfurreducens]ADI83926.1 quinone biosynthesis kinase AarF, putative [Geobacter sulfurreducens KN400]AJY70809.1 ubiquinone biosynthesis protein UbiB [Geobacter sulfurreducens]HML79775.1 AarF/UbiB family protein [Geobacter sulfurreducens]